jgi:hypothetical protein
MICVQKKTFFSCSIFVFNFFGKKIGRNKEKAKKKANKKPPP